MVVPLHLCLLVGWLIHCPHCKKGSVFSGFLTVHKLCPECDYELDKHETADGPAFLVMIIMGFLICGLAAWVEIKYEPAFWIHAVLWIPAICIGSPFMLRYLKGWLINYQYTLTNED